MADPLAHGVGAFAPLQLPLLLPSLLLAYPTGRVRVTQGASQRYLWFAEGRVLAITSALEDERLGSWLVARGLIEKRALQDALGRQLPGQRLGTMLVARRLISGELVSQELEVLTFTLAGRLLVEGGTYEVEHPTTLPDDAVVVDFLPEPLFALAARRAQDTGQLERLAGGSRRWVAAAGAASWEGDVELLGLERAVIAALGRPASLAELQVKLGQTTRQVSRAVVCLAVLGLARELTASPQPEVVARPFPAANARLRQLLSQVDPTAQHGPAVVASCAQELDVEAAEDRKQEALTMLRSGGDPRRAQKLLAAAVEVVPDAACLTVLAELEMHNPLWRARALERLKQAVVLAPKHTAAWLALANYWSLRLQPDKQRRCLEKILAYEPGNQEARSAVELLEPESRW